MIEHGSGNKYTYDAANQRLRKTENGDSTYYVTNGLEVLAEYDENDNLQAEHIYGLGRMLAKFDSGGERTFFYTDHLGSTRLVSGESEASDDMRRDYYPYGEALTAAGNDDTPYTFVGKELDSATGLHYFGARYYFSGIGRWLVPDALADRYLAWSPYNYGLANPVNLVDRDGDAVFLPIIAVAVAGALIADLIDPNPANAPGPGDPVFQGKSDVEFAVGEGIGAALGIGLARAVGKLAGSFIDDVVGKGGTEIVERAMSKAELKATKETGLVRGGREGEHFVTDSANKNAKRARQRLALKDTPEVRAQLEVPEGQFSKPTKVEPKFGMPGGGTERVATGNIPAKVKKVQEYEKRKK